jgi:hypothetical protein
MRRGVAERLVFGGGRRWPWAVVAGAGLLGMAGAVAPWDDVARPWSGIHVGHHKGVLSYPHDARQCFALAAIVVVVGVAGWFGVRGLVSRLVLLVCGVVVAFIPFADWVWLGSSAPNPPPRALARLMEHLPHSPSVDAAHHADTSSRGWGLLLTTAAGLLVVAAAVVPASWPKTVLGRTSSPER